MYENSLDPDQLASYKCSHKDKTSVLDTQKNALCKFETLWSVILAFPGHTHLLSVHKNIQQHESKLNPLYSGGFLHTYWYNK